MQAKTVQRVDKTRLSSEVFDEEPEPKRQCRSALKDKHCSSEAAGSLSNALVNPSHSAVARNNDEALIRKLYNHADNSKLRSGFVKDIVRVLYLSYRQLDPADIAQDNAVFQIIQPDIRKFFNQFDRCKQAIPGLRDRACRVLGEEQISIARTRDLLVLLEHLMQLPEPQRREEKSERNALCQALQATIQELVIAENSIATWCSQKEVFIWYVSEFSAKVCASIAADSALAVIDPAADDHYLAKQLAKAQSEDLRSTVIAWERQAEQVSSAFLQGKVVSFHELSTLRKQLARIKACSSAVSFEEEKEEKDVERRMRSYLHYANHVTSLLSDPEGLDREYPTDWWNTLDIVGKSGHMALTRWMLKYCENEKNSRDDRSKFDENLKAVLNGLVCGGRFMLLRALLCDYKPDLTEEEYLACANTPGFGKHDVENCTLLLTAVTAAATAGKLDTVQCILDELERSGHIYKDLNPQKIVSSEIVTAATYAAQFADERTFRLIFPYLQQQPDCLNTVGPSTYEAPFYCAVAGGNHNIVRLCLQLDVDPNLTTEYGYAPLHAAVGSGDLELVKLLLRIPALNLNCQCDPFWDGRYPQLDKKMDRAHWDIEDGISIAFSKGDTALMHAAFRGFTEIVKVLVDAWADISVVNAFGETAITIARESGHESLANFLDEVRRGREETNVEEGTGCVYRFFNNDNKPYVSKVSADLILSYLGNDFRPNS